MAPGGHGQGLGRQLLAAAARLALASAPRRGLDLYVYTANTPARGFYARAGGQDMGEWLETAPDGSSQLVRRIWWADPAVLRAAEGTAKPAAPKRSSAAGGLP